MKQIVILGGSGMIGSYLSKLLVIKGYSVIILTRNKILKSSSTTNIKYSYWNPEKSIIDINAIKDANCFINLSGENISRGRWTKRRKDKILNSRIQPLNFILNVFKENSISPNTFISTSAIGFYGTLTSDKIFSETSPKGSDFLATVCAQWEDKVNIFRKIGSRVIILRTGVVLSTSGGVLKKMMLPAKLGLFAIIGSGKQYFPWIHIHDLCKIIIFSIENKSLNETYNAVASEHINNTQFTVALSKATEFKLFILKIPAWGLKLILGEMAIMLLKGSRISNKKILEEGFNFQYDNIDSCLNNLIKKSKTTP